MSSEPAAPSSTKTLSPADLFALAVTRVMADRTQVHFQQRDDREKESGGLPGSPPAEVFAGIARSNQTDIQKYVKAHADEEDLVVWDSMVTSIHYSITMLLELREK